MASGDLRAPGTQAGGQGRRRKTRAMGTGPQPGVAAAAALAESVLAAEIPAPDPAAGRPTRARGKRAQGEAAALAEVAGPAIASAAAEPAPGVEVVAVVEALNSAGAAVLAAEAAVPVTLGEQLARMRVVVFDVETTGTDRRNDQVIELGVQLGLDTTATGRTWRFRPEVPIHPGAQAVHGISMADLEGCPVFRDCLDEVAAVFEQAEVIIGYNIAFDIDMLAAEYERAGRKPIDFSGKTIVDAFRLWQQCEPRSLQHAHQRFVGDRFTAAHSASADVAATGRVLAGMLRAFGLEQQDWGAIAGLCDPQRATWIGPTRHLRWEAGAVILGFGKYAGAALHKIAHGPDRSFLRWVLDRDFPPHVVEICRAALELAARAAQVDDAAEPIAAWVRERFGAPSAAPALSAAG